MIDDCLYLSVIYWLFVKVTRWDQSVDRYLALLVWSANFFYEKFLSFLLGSMNRVLRAREIHMPNPESVMMIMMMMMKEWERYNVHSILPFLFVCSLFLSRVFRFDSALSGWTRSCEEGKKLSDSSFDFLRRVESTPSLWRRIQTN